MYSSLCHLFMEFTWHILCDLHVYTVILHLCMFWIVFYLHSWFKFTAKGVIQYILSQIDIEDIELGEPLGRGGYDGLFNAKWKGKVVAVKTMKKGRKFYHLPCHSNIITYYGSAYSDIQEYVVMELAVHGSLHDYIFDKRNNPSYEESLKWSAEIATAIEYLHKNGITHGELMPSKVLLTDQLTAKLGIIFESEDTRTRSINDDYRWMAPELVMDKDSPSQKADIFAYAMMLIELWEHKLPYDDITGVRALIAIVQGDRPTTSKKSPKVITDIMQKCWVADPKERPDISTVLHSLHQMPPTPPDDDTTMIIAIDDIEMDRSPIAQGGFGAVYRGQWKSANKTVAVKVGQCTVREVDMFSTMEPHPNIITFYGLVKVSKIETRIVMEFADKGTIHTHMKALRGKGKRLEPALSLQWAMEVALGVQHLHNNDIVHRDLKPKNVLLVGEMLEAKLTDFGSVRDLPNTAIASAFGTTLLYQAPESSPMEIDKVAVISKKYDSYSYGIVLWELLTSKQPFDGMNEKAVFFKVITENLRPNIGDIRSDFKDYLAKLVQSCWETDYKKRPSFTDIVTALQNETF